VKGHRLHVRRKMKKIKVTLTKRLLRINSWLLVSSVLEFSLFSLSHSWTLRVLLEHFSIGSRKAKKEKRKQRSSKEEQDKIATIDLHV